MSHLTFGRNFNQTLSQHSIPANLRQLSFKGCMYIEIDDTVLENIELEINYYHENIYFNKSRIVNLFDYGHNRKIPRTNVDSDEFIIKDEWNDYIDNTPVTKIKLIPKIIF